MAYIYKTTNKINNKIYVGKTELCIYRGFREHLASVKREKFKNRPLYSAMLKYGVENFVLELVEETSEPDTREEFWISFYNSKDSGYNATFGGDGKPYIDRGKVFSLHAQGLSPTEIADTLGHDRAYMKDIIVAAGLVPNKPKVTKRRPYCKKVLCLTNGICFISVRDAAKYFIELNSLDPNNEGGYSTHIVSACMGKRKTAFRCTWQYI